MQENAKDGRLPSQLQATEWPRLGSSRDQKVSSALHPRQDVGYHPLIKLWQPGSGPRLRNTALQGGAQIPSSHNSARPSVEDNEADVVSWFSGKCSSRAGLEPPPNAGETPRFTTHRAGSRSSALLPPRGSWWLLHASGTPEVAGTWKTNVDLENSGSLLRVGGGWPQMCKGGVS